MSPRRKLACLAAGVLAASFAYFVWPTPWAYDAWTIPGGLGYLRRNRITNSVEWIHKGSKDGWVPFGDDSP